MRHLFSGADLALAKRLETADAVNVQAMARVLSEHLAEAAAEPFAGGIAIFAGVGSPMTHAIGIGLSGCVSDQEMDRMETFFRNRGSACLIDLCPLADPSVIAFVQSRPYRIIEFNNVMVRRIERDEMFEQVAGIRRVLKPEMPRWCSVVSEGFAEQMPVLPEMADVMAAVGGESQCWLAGKEESVAGAAMGIRDGTALFYGDATLPPARRQGWQSAFIRCRLAAAQQQGCDLAMACVLPGSGSHRNYERAGFQLVYMRVNLTREFA